MFQKEFRVKCSAPLKGAEQKKLKCTVGKCFNLSDDTLDEFLNHKQLTQLKVITCTNDIVKIYCAQDVAIVFDFKGKYYPTLFMLWKFPLIVPRLKLDVNVTSRIKTVTELTIKDLNSVNNDHVLNSLAVDQCVSVSSDTCQKIIAVGYLIVDGNTIQNHRTNKDKCFKVLHYHKDELFKSHILQIIPEVVLDIERTFKNAPESSDDATNRLENAQTVVEKMDELLTLCSLKALKHSIKKEMLPILASTFYKKYVMSFCPEGIELDIKKTSFKKLSTFLQLLDEEGIIKFNVGSNGIAEITRVNHTSSKFQDARLDDNVESNENTDQASLPVKEIYVVTPGLHPIFSEFLSKAMN